MPPSSGSNNKAGIIVHEHSHFIVTGGTKDYVYGQDDAKDLASENSSAAILNAEYAPLILSLESTI